MEPRKREEEEALGFLSLQGRVHTELPVNSQSASGQSYQAAGQPTCASLQCKALKLWRLCWAQSQVPGRAPRTTFSKSSIHTAVVGSRRQERDGRDKGAPFLEAPTSSKKVKEAWGAEGK